MSPDAAEMTRERECDRMLEAYGAANFAGVIVAFDRQLTTLHNRAQVLLGICGVLISASVLVTTGRIVGRSDYDAQSPVSLPLIVAGGLAIAAAALLCARVLDIHFITQQPGSALRPWVLANIAYRERKMLAYRISTYLLLMSMAAYQISVTMALLT